MTAMSLLANCYAGAKPSELHSLRLSW